GRVAIAVIADGGRHRALGAHEFVAGAVELGGGDPGHDLRGDEVERGGRHPPGPPHGGEAAGAVDLDRPPVGIVVAVVRHGVLVSAPAHGRQYLARHLDRLLGGAAGGCGLDGGGALPEGGGEGDPASEPAL